MMGPTHDMLAAVQFEWFCRVYCELDAISSDERERLERIEVYLVIRTNREA